MSGSWHDMGPVILGVSYLTELGLNLDFSKKIQRRFNSRFVGGWRWLRSSGRKTEEWLFLDADVISSSRILRIGPENIYLRNVGSRFQVVNFKKTMDWLNDQTHSLSFSTTKPARNLPTNVVGLICDYKNPWKKHLIGSGFLSPSHDQLEHLLVCFSLSPTSWGTFPSPFRKAPCFEEGSGDVVPIYCFGKGPFCLKFL